MDSTSSIVSIPPMNLVSIAKRYVDLFSPSLSWTIDSYITAKRRYYTIGYGTRAPLRIPTADPSNTPCSHSRRQYLTSSRSLHTHSPTSRLKYDSLHTQSHRSVALCLQIRSAEINTSRHEILLACIIRTFPRTSVCSARPPPHSMCSTQSMLVHAPALNAMLYVRMHHTWSLCI